MVNDSPCRFVKMVIALSSRPPQHFSRSWNLSMLLPALSFDVLQLDVLMYAQHVNATSTFDMHVNATSTFGMAHFVGALPNPWEPAATLPSWIAILLIGFTVWCRDFLSRRKPDAIRREEEQKRDMILERMKALLAYANSESSKEQTPPEAERVLELLWDDIHGCRTLSYGVPAEGDLNVRTEALYRTVSEAELRRICDWTRRGKSASHLWKLLPSGTHIPSCYHDWSLPGHRTAW